MTRGGAANKTRVKASPGRLSAATWEAISFARSKRLLSVARRAIE